jgi:hypothetical protein
MYDFYYSKLLNDTSKFLPRVGNKGVTFFSNGAQDDSAHALQVVDLEDPQISAWLRGEDFLASWKTPTQPRYDSNAKLRILIGSPEIHSSDAEVLPLPLSKEVFEEVRAHWQLPKELLRMMLSTLPFAMRFDVTTSDATHSRSGLLARSARSRDWNFCLGLVHDREHDITNVVINGLQAAEVEILLKCLRESLPVLTDPMILPLFLLELKVHYFAVLLEKRAAGIEDIELATGMRHGFSTNPRRRESRHLERERLLKDINFDEITQKLTGLTGTLSFCHMTFSTSLKALELIHEVRTHFLASVQGGESGLSSSRGAVDIRLSYLRELILGAQSHGEVLSARTRAQVQTVSPFSSFKRQKTDLRPLGLQHDRPEGQQTQY